MRATYFSHCPTTRPLTEPQPACPPSSSIEPSNDDVMGSWETSCNERTVFYEGIFSGKPEAIWVVAISVRDCSPFDQIRILGYLGTPN